MRSQRPDVHQPKPVLVRTAVIVGTATVMSTAIWRRHAARHADPLGAPPAEDPPPTGMTVDQLNRLARLGELRKAEVLSPEEFEVQKAQILGGVP